MKEIFTLWSSSSLKRMALALLFFTSMTVVRAATITSTTTGGSWTATTTWVGGNVPAATDDAVIAGPVTIATSDNITINALTINSGATLDASAAGSYTLTVSGDWTNNGTFAPGGGTVALNGTALQTIGGSAITAFNDLTISNTTAPVSVTTTADITIAGTMTVNANSVFAPGAANTIAVGTSSGVLSGAGTYQVTRIGSGAAGDFATQYPIVTANTPGVQNLTIDYAGTGDQTVNGYTYGNLTASGSGIKTADGTIKVQNNLTVTGTATLDLGTFIADYTGSGSGTLSITDGAALRISGGHVLPQNYTTYTFSPASTVEYYGGGTRAIHARTYGNLMLSDATTLIADGALTITGNFTIGTGATFNATNAGVNNFTHTILGNWMNDGTFNGSTTTISFEGTTMQTIDGGAGTSTTFTNLAINNGTGGSVVIAQNTFVTGVLTLTNGIVTTPALASSTSAALLIINNHATVTGASDNSYVSGPITKVGYQPFTFPVGKATIGGTSATGYNPITISSPYNLDVTANATNAFTAEYFNASAHAVSPAIANPTTPPGLQQVSACQYWTLNRTTNSSSVDVTLSWKANSKCNASAYITDPASVVVAHSNGTQWDSYGNDGGTTGDATAGTVTWKNVSTFSPFTLGTTDAGLNPLPVTITSFSGRKLDGGTQLTWQVAGEENVKGYEIERRTGNGQFASIGFVAATGSSSYTFTDASQQKGLVFYRLKNVDQDGRIAYSTILSFRSGTGILVFPTLVTNQTTILHDAAPATALISLSTADGKQVKLQKPQLGATQTVVDMTGLQPGLYLLRWSSGTGDVQTTKVVKQ